MTVIIVAGIVFVVVTIALIVKEAKNAPLIDDRAPFLWDDYDPKNDPTSAFFEEELHHTETFCKNCKFYDGTAMCLHENNFGEININLINYCKKNAIFEAK